MKIVESSQLAESSKEPGVLDRARETLNVSWLKKQATAEDIFIAALNRTLDNKYYLLREVTLDGLDFPVPLILISPSGTHVIFPSNLKGIYRAKEDVWEVLDEHNRRFKAARPNLLTATERMARALDDQLEAQGYELPATEPLLFFSDPGIHVDTQRPVTRVVLADALERYVAGLLQKQSVMAPETVQKIVRSLVGEVPLTNVQKIPEHDAFSFLDNDEEQPPKPSKPKVIVDQSEPDFLERIPFNRRQWLILGMLLVVNIIILSALVVFVLVSS
jgi:hypothetical protein